MDDPALRRSLVADLQSWQILVSIVDLGSFRAAGEVHRMSAANVSNRIKKLESRFQCQLLRRTTRRLVLTPEGRVIYNTSQKLTQELKLARDEIAPVSSLVGDVSITWPTAMITPLIESSIMDFKRANPFVNLQIERYDSRAVSIVDIALTSGEATASQATRFDLGEHGVLAASTRPLADLPEGPESLATSPIIVAGLEDHLILQTGRHPDAESLRLPVALAADDPDFLLAAVLQNVGVAVLPMIYARQLLKTTRSIGLLPGFDLYRRNCHLTLTENTQGQSTAATRALARLIRDALRTALGDGRAD